MADRMVQVESKEAIDRLVGMFRTRLENAVRDGQAIRMVGREGHKALPQSAPLSSAEPDGSFELHVYIAARS